MLDLVSQLNEWGSSQNKKTIEGLNTYCTEEMSFLSARGFNNVVLSRKRFSLELTWEPGTGVEEEEDEKLVWRVGGSVADRSRKVRPRRRKLVKMGGEKRGRWFGAWRKQGRGTVGAGKDVLEPGRTSWGGGGGA